MNELDRIMLEAIRHRVASPGTSIGTAAKDRAWLLARFDAPLEASRVLVDAAQSGADAYEVRPELALLADAAGLDVPSHWRPRERPSQRLMDCVFCGELQGLEDFTSVLTDGEPVGWHPRCRPDPPGWLPGDVAYLELPPGATAPSGWHLVDGRWQRVLQPGDVLPPGRIEVADR